MTPEPNTISTPRNRSGAKLLTVILVIAVIGATASFVWAEQQRRAAVKQLEQTTAKLTETKRATQNGGAEVAKEVLAKLRKHIDIPTDPAPTIATITDIDKLKATNEFYSSAKNGDQLIVTSKRAILYDPKRDIILDIVPVQINQTASPAPGASSAPVASPTVTPRGTLRTTAQPTP